MEVFAIREINREIIELKEKLGQSRPAKWDDFPDIELYMDQVLTYMERQYIDTENDILTSAMVNNYVKSGVLPRANGKKYDKEHLAYLTATSMLKQVITVSDMEILLKEKIKNTGTGIEDFYSYYCRTLDRELSATADVFPSDVGLEILPTIALELAVSSYAQKMVCRRLIKIIAEQNTPQENPPDKKSVKKAEKKSDKKSEKKSEKK